MRIIALALMLLASCSKSYDYGVSKPFEGTYRDSAGSKNQVDIVHNKGDYFLFRYTVNGITTNFDSVIVKPDNIFIDDEFVDGVAGAAHSTGAGSFGDGSVDLDFIVSDSVHHKFQGVQQK